MTSLKQNLTNIVAAAFEACGIDKKYGAVEVSTRRELADYQCNGALAAAKPYKKNPRQIGQDVMEKLQTTAGDVFAEISLAGPGFINLRLNNEWLASRAQAMAADDSGRFGVVAAEEPLMIILDYGGPNVAKPLHVGHVRTGIIGECLKRLCRFLGHEALGDIHMGDWGLPIGQIITELQERDPSMPYFDADYSGPYPEESPVTVQELAEIYPTASGKSKTDETFRAKAQKATSELQEGRPGYRALWQHFMDVSIADLKQNYGSLQVDYDLWLGEADVNDLIDPMVDKLKAEGHAYLSDGAIVIDVKDDADKKEMEPLMIVKSNGSVGYEATDMATIIQRVRDYDPDLVWYIVDGRQQHHFKKVFRAVYKSGIADKSKVSLEHTYNGTINGPDGKPFKTRDGGVMSLQVLVEMVIQKARERLAEIDSAADYSAEEREEIAQKVGIAALKFSDLVNHRTVDYIFDLERFSSFEGRTGPYLLYAAVRNRSILRKAAEEGLSAGEILPPAGDEERELQLKLLELPDLLNFTFDQRAPNHLCDYAYNLAIAFNRFYRAHHILNETDKAQQASWLGVAQLTVGVLELVLELLGISVPERM